MGNGKPGVAPCGHPGEHVFGQYVMCPTCDAPKPAPKHDPEARNKWINAGLFGADDLVTPEAPDPAECPNCTSMNVTTYALVSMYQCNACSHIWATYVAGTP